MSLLDEIKTQSQTTDSVLVSFSIGKDSIVTMDLCKQYFKHVQPFFMYLVPGLKFQEDALAKYEKYWNVSIIEVPNFEAVNFYRYGSFRDTDYSVSRVNIEAIYEALRGNTGMFWIAGGDKLNDSIARRAMLNYSGSIDEQNGRFYPVMYWTDKEIKQYIKMKHLFYPKLNQELGCNFHSLSGKELSAIKRIYPQDYQRILKFFPEAEGSNE